MTNSPPFMPAVNAMEVSGKTRLVRSTIAVNTTQYSAGDLVGAKNSLADAVDEATGKMTGLIQALTLADLTQQNAELDIVFFNADPSATTFTNNSGLDVNDADLLKIIGTVTILAADYVDFVDNSVAHVSGLAIPFELTATDRILYYAVVSRGTPTYAANELQLTVAILLD